MMMGDRGGMQALILAGGEGRRLRHTTAFLPKPLLYLPAGTLLDHQLALLSRLPVSHTFVVIHHLAEQLEQALQGREALTALRQSPPFTLLGALASAEGHLTERFIVLHADNYFSLGLEYLLQEAESAASGLRADAVFLVDSLADQPDRAGYLATTGCYILSPKVFPIVRGSQDKDELSHLTSALLGYGARVEEVPLRGWRGNINLLEDLLRMSNRILGEWRECFHPPEADDGYNRAEGCLKVEYPLWISRESEVVDSYLGPYVVVGPRARVVECALREVVVFPGAQLVNQRLEHGVVLPAGKGFVPLPSQEQVHPDQKSRAEEEPP
jgi:glucose-1-phosphate thymidylyltransferase